MALKKNSSYVSQTDQNLTDQRNITAYSLEDESYNYTILSHSTKQI